MPNGNRCKSPALKGAFFCYFHARIHKRDADPLPVDGHLRLPFAEDPASIQFSIAQICDALCAGRIDAKLAGRLLYAMQIASSNVDKASLYVGMKTVESTTQSPEGDDLAPESRICTGEDECRDCRFAKTCPNYDPDEDDDDN